MRGLKLRHDFRHPLAERMSLGVRYGYHPVWSRIYMALLVRLTA